MAFEFKDSSTQEKTFEKVLIPSKQYNVAHLKSYKVYNRKKDGQERMVWTFEIVTKKGTFEVPGFTTTKFGINPETGAPATARAWMAALQGKNGTDEDLIRDMDQMVGRPCQVITTTMGKGEDEKSVIDKVLPVSDSEEEDF